MTSPHRNVLATLVLSLLIAMTPASSLIKQKLLSEVIATRLGTSGRLKNSTSFHKHNSVKRACFLECLQTSSCEFVCINQGVCNYVYFVGWSARVTGRHAARTYICKDGITCDLYKLYVSAHWVGETSGTIYSSCYTSWGLPSNVIRPTMAVTYSAVLSTSYPGVALIDGFAGRSSATSCFESTSIAHSYWQVDLGALVRVKAVTVATYSNSYFRNADVRLGNSSNHLSNPVFGSVVTSPSYDTITITGNVYAGRYLALSNQNSGYLIVCEIQVHQD